MSGTQRHHSRGILQPSDTEPSRSVVFINPSPIYEHEWEIQTIGRWWLNSSHLFFSAGSKQFSGYSTVVLLYSNIILKKKEKAPDPCDLFGEVWNLQVSKLLVLNMVLFLLFFTWSKTVYYHQGCSWKKAGGNVLHIYLKTFTAVITVGAMAINGTEEPITLQTPCFWPDFFPFLTLNRLWRKCCLNSVSYYSKDFTQHAVILVFKCYALLFACKNLLFCCV